MPSVTVVGAGLAGLAATAGLADAGFTVDVFEARPYPGGRATSYAVPAADGRLETIDNCQHILLRCCTNLLDFYRRLGISGQVEFHREFYWIERGGRISPFKAGRLPRPAHFASSFLTLKFLSLGEKAALGRAILALQTEAGKRTDLQSITMLDWLKEKHQPERVIERFWRQVLVSAVNEELDRMAASYGFQVFLLGFLATRDAYEMGVPEVPLGELYHSQFWARWANVRFHFRTPVRLLDGACELQDGRKVLSDYYVVAVPFERVGGILPGLEMPNFEHSPITSVNLWFDRPVTNLPHATLLDSPLQWMFNKGAGRYLQIVVSASRSWTEVGQSDLTRITLDELGAFFPAVRNATLMRSRIVKEIRATISATPGLEAVRPGAVTPLRNVFLAGDWTQTGWPSTMEGAVRSGYVAAEAVTAAHGVRCQFLVPEIDARF